MLNRLIWVVWRPILKLGLRFLPLEDPWERASALVPLRRFGTGSVNDFKWYFEGTSTVAITDVAALCDWLAGCSYVKDIELFRKPDFWQHPLQFEDLRKGDCDDHALWAWRKLVELGYRAELVSGDLKRADGTWGGHVWVCFEENGQHFLVESVAKDQSLIVRPLDAVKASYCPNVAVGHDFVRSGFHGILHSMKREMYGTQEGAA